MSDYRLYIDGRFVSSNAGTIDVINPATQEIIGRTPDGTLVDVDAAVKAARKAFESGSWPETTAQERGRREFFAEYHIQVCTPMRDYRS